jgi:excisionase family DNA binding protein
MSREEAARYIGVGTTTFDRLIEERRMPRPARVGKRVIWDRFKLDAAFSELGEATENAIDRALSMGPDGDQEHWNRVAQERGAALDRGVDPDTGTPLRRRRQRR